MTRDEALRRAWATAQNYKTAQFVYRHNNDFVIRDTLPPLNDWPHSEVLRVEPSGCYSSVSQSEVHRALRERDRQTNPEW